MEQIVTSTKNSLDEDRSKIRLIKNWANERLSFIRNLDKSQRFSLAILVLLVLVLPLGVRMVFMPRAPRYPYATPITSPTSTSTPTVSQTPSPTPKATPTITPIPSMQIQVLQPNGGETLYVGDVYRISWTSSPNIDMVSIGYSTGPGSLNWIVTNVPNSYYYDWTVYVGNTANTQFKIQIIGYDVGYGSVSDQSDDYFTVLPKPLTPTPATPTLTPTFTPTPTPIVSQGTAPIFITERLRVGFVGRRYRSLIKVVDSDGDRLEMSIVNLAPGLTQGECRFSQDKSNTSELDCEIGGVPLRAGVYYPFAIVTDEKGLTTTRKFTQIVFPRYLVF